MHQLLFAGTWLHVPIVVALGLLVAAFAVHGRGVGAGWPGARSVGSLALIGLCFGLAGFPGGLMGLGWVISRTTKFKANTATPQTKAEFLGAAVRQVPAMIAAGICAIGLGRWTMLPAAALWLAIFLALASWYGDRKAAAVEAGVGINPLDNVKVELAQAGALGAAVWVGLILA